MTTISDDFEATIDQVARIEADRQKRLSKVEIISGKALMQKSFPEPRYLWDSALPDSGLAVMAASKAAGKTLLLLQLADAVSRGREFLGLPTRLTKTLFIEMELSERRMQQRLFKMGIIASDMLHFAHKWTQGDEGLQTITDAVKEHGYGLVIVDVMQMLWPMDADTNSYQDTYSVLSPLRQIANDLGVMILLVTHRRKMESADYLDGVIGSVGISANADVVFSLIRTRGEKEAVLHIDGNDIESRKIALCFNTDPLGFSLSDATPEEIGLTQERREIVDAIRKLGGTAKPVQLADVLGKDEKAVSKLCRKLTIDGLLRNPKYGVFAVPTSEKAGEVGEVGEVDNNYLGTSTTSTTSPSALRLGKPATEWPAALQNPNDEEELF